MVAYKTYGDLDFVSPSVPSGLVAASLYVDEGDHTYVAPGWNTATEAEFAQYCDEQEFLNADWLSTRSPLRYRMTGSYAHSNQAPESYHRDSQEYGRLMPKRLWGDDCSPIGVRWYWDHAAAYGSGDVYYESDGSVAYDEDTLAVADVVHCYRSPATTLVESVTTLRFFMLEDGSVGHCDVWKRYLGVDEGIAASCAARRRCWEECKTQAAVLYSTYGLHNEGETVQESLRALAGSAVAGGYVEQFVEGYTQSLIEWNDASTDPAYTTDLPGLPYSVRDLVGIRLSNAI